MTAVCCCRGDGAIVMLPVDHSMPPVASWLLLLLLLVSVVVPVLGLAFIRSSSQAFPRRHRQQHLPCRRLPIIGYGNGIMNGYCGDGEAQASSFTWIGGYRIDIVDDDDGATMPPAAGEEGAIFQRHVEGATPPDPGAALVRLWRISRLGDDDYDDGVAPALAGMAGVNAAASAAFLLGDLGLLGDSEVCRLVLQTLAPSPSPDEASSDDAGGVEMVSWVDNHGRDLLPPGSPGLPRLLVHRLNILHKGAGIFVREEPGEGARVFVHQRADHKRIFPSMHDMFVGGVSLHGESTEATARRELKEELGFGRPGAFFRFLYSCFVRTSYNRCFVDVFEYVLQPGEASDVKLDPEEVKWGAFVPLEEVKERVRRNAGPGEWTFVPDGLLVWEELVEYWERTRQK